MVEPPAIPRHTGFLEHDGERLYFETAGEGGVPLVLCHGLGGNHAVWFQQVAPFARNRLVVTWDHRGFGRSTDRAGRSGPDVAWSDLLAIMDHLGLDRADAAGQSMGGWSVVGAALAQPRRFRRLVLADSLGGFSPEGGGGGRGVSAAPGASTAPGAGRGRLGVHPALDASFSTAQPELAHLYQAVGEMRSADTDTLFERLVAARRGLGDASRLAVPVLFVVGERDGLFPPETVRSVAGAFPNARVVEIPGCGHSPYFEAPSEWNRSVRAFLDSSG